MDKKILEKLEIIKKDYLQAQKEFNTLDFNSDLKKSTSLNKIIKKNQSTYEAFIEWQKLIKEIEDAKNIISSEKDQEMISELKNIILESKQKIDKLESSILELIIEKDPNDERDVIMEIQGAAGGDEAKIFVGDLFRMYQRFFDKMNWNIETINSDETGNGGYSNLSFYVRGLDVFKYLKYESGVHRVQRIPTTETQGRIHTSTVTVSVMPEVEEVDLEINSSDIRIDTFRSGGKGGQHANKTDSAVRITHIPTGIVVQSQNERSQHQNKEIAMNILRSRIFEIKIQEEFDKNSSAKKNLVGTGDRSEKIRTYNYPQNRITDHRIGLTLKKLDRIMEGNLSQILDVLIAGIDNQN